MSVFQGRPKETNLYLALSGTAATGILYTAVTVKYRKFGQLTLTTKVLTSADWTEVGNGFYILRWLPTDLDTLGDFFFSVAGSGFDFQWGEFDVDPVPLPLFVPPSTCVVSGTVMDLGGRPGQGQAIVVSGPDFPAKNGAALLVADLIRTQPDSFGNFSLPLIQGQTVLIEIERAGIKNQIVIPNAPTANLTDLLPPF